MLVTNSDIWNACTALRQVIQEPWPVKTAYWLARLAKAVNAEYAVLDQVRIGLVRQYGTGNGEGQVTVAPDSANWETFSTAFNELMAQEVEFPFEKVVLPDLDGLRVTPQVLLNLEAFVEVA